MKTFFHQSDSGHSASVLTAGSPAANPPGTARSGLEPSVCNARVAVYEAPAAAPRTEDISSADPREFIEAVSARVHSLARETGGSLPYTVIRELVENFVHADFAEPVVSVLDGGSTIRFADQGPGVPDKERASLPGFTTATSDMKRVIRGVGSGLPIVREWLDLSGGSLLIEDNLREGTVVTVSCDPPTPSAREDSSPTPGPARLFDAPPLSTRQKQVLSLVLELGEAGPTIVSRELSVALSTAYRDLAYLESSGLIQADETGKRILTEAGSRFLDDLFIR